MIKTTKIKFTGRKLNADGAPYQIVETLPGGIDTDAIDELREWLSDRYEHISGIEAIEDFRPLTHIDPDGPGYSELVEDFCQFFGFDRIIRTKSGQWQGNHPNIIGMMLMIANSDEQIMTLYNRG